MTVYGRKGAWCRRTLVAAAVIVIFSVLFTWHLPPLWHPLSKQTIYVGMTQAWHSLCSGIMHSQPSESRATALWIDDDSQPGVASVKRVADELGVKAVFAVIPALMEQSVSDSLRQWQHEGFGIALHGLHHEDWKNWSQERIANDIRESRRILALRGLDTTCLAPIIVSPFGSNTRAIRHAVQAEGCKLVAGAQLANADTTPGQWGRIWITSQTDTTHMRRWLQQAHKRQAFVVFATHSGASQSYSEQLTLAVLRMAQDMGYKFIQTTEL